jgi:hypothetical protein
VNSIEIKLPRGGYIKSFPDFITYHKSARETYQLGYSIADGIHVLDGTVRQVGLAARSSKDFPAADASTILRDVVDYLGSHQIEADVIQE